MNKSIQHLFFDCPYARFVQRVAQVYFNLNPSSNTHDLFNGWMQGVDKKLKYKILAKACTLC
jgi:hypothetical protein